MAQTITVNGVTSLDIPRDAVEWAESAYLGEVGTGKFTVHDGAGTVDIPGHKFISVAQSSAATPRIFSGYAGHKSISRGTVYDVGAARVIDVETKDLNDLLTRLAIWDTDGKRPAETISARLTWLLASTYLTGLVSDYGACTYSTSVGMDANDYRGQYPGDVLAAMAKSARFNYYVRWNAASAAPELVFRDDNASTADTATVTISNAAGEADSTTVFAPFQDAGLSEDPEHVYSGAIANYGKGTTRVTRAATATAFASRDGITEDTGVKTLATAQRDATTFLWESHTEEQLLSLSLRMRASQVNLITPGMRVNTKMTHMNPEGWASGQYARVLRRRVTQPLNTDNDYDVQLDLSPQEAAPVVATIVQYAFDRGADGGLTLTLPNPVTVGNTLVFVSGAPNQTDPVAPNTSDASLPRFGSTAWARLNGSTITRIGAPPTAACSAYYKTADTAERSGWIASQDPVCGILELSGATPASTVVQYVDTTLAVTNYDIGAAITPTAGQVAVAIWITGDRDPYGGWTWARGTPLAWQTPNPNPNLASGWTLGISKWSYDHWSLTDYVPSGVWTTIAYAAGTGASLTPRMQPGENHYYGAILLKIP